MISDLKEEGIVGDRWINEDGSYKEYNMYTNLQGYSWTFKIKLKEIFSNWSIEFGGEKV